MFSWNLPSDLEKAFANSRMPCFNPCFRGTCPRTLLQREHSERQKRVSILVFVELALGLSQVFYISNNLRVSILVFVELALGLDITIFIFSTYIGFQSLFSWNLPSDPDRISQSWPRQSVSILVFVELALGLCAVVVIFVTSHLFQSLFSWNLPSDFAFPIHISMTRSGFNPCFRGTCPRTSQAFFGINLFSHLFQSLFSWNLPSDFRTSLWATFLPCFNPCFRGTCPRTLSSFLFFAISPRFQSLFSWNLPSDSRLSSFSVLSLALFQSLFSWNLPSDCLLSVWVVGNK